MPTAQEALKQLDESNISRFQLKTVIIAGMGFFTDAYDLFIIGVVASILKPIWHLNAFEISLLTSTALLAAAVGAIVFGRVADIFGRKFIYGYELIVLAAGAIASALAPGLIWLLISRVVLGLGIGGDYPVSSTLMSEYSNRRDRGKLITLVFSTQALGLIIGPLLAYIFLKSGISQELIWRVLLGLGAVPALATFWQRRKIGETPRFALAKGNAQDVSQAVDMASDKKGAEKAAPESSNGQLPQKDTAQSEQAPQSSSADEGNKVHWQELFSVRHLLIWLIGAAGTWFLLDIAYYGTTVSTPFVIKLFSPKATLETTMLYTLVIFVFAALPGYIVAIFLVDRMGRKVMQLLGFGMMAISFGTLFFFPALTTVTVSFLLLYGASYFFTEFGPNVTTFLYPAEIFPVTVRTTRHP